jgi:hypothetical protein
MQKLREPVGGKLRKTLTENARTNSHGIRVGVGGLVTFPPTAAPKKRVLLLGLLRSHP